MTLLRAGARAGAVAGVAAVALVSIGAAVGRFHATPVGAHGPGVQVERRDLAVIVPVRPLQVRAGDILMARPRDAGHEELVKIVAVDSWTHDVFTIDAQGRPEKPSIE